MHEADTMNDVDFLDRRDLWPGGGRYCCLKRRHPDPHFRSGSGSNYQFGFMIAAGPRYRIQLGNFFAVYESRDHETNQAAFEACPVIDYESAAEIVAEGWIVD